MRKWIKVALVATIGVAPATASVGASISHGASVPLTSTDFTSSMALPKFDTSMGILTGISIRVDATVFGSIGVENLTPGPASISYSLEALIRLEKPDHSLFAEVLPLFPLSDDFDAFDGILNFEGQSGETHRDVAASSTETVDVSPGDFAFFEGAGSISLPLIGRGSAPAPQGFRFFEITAAGADVTVTYSYTPTSQDIPEPAPLAVALFGMLGLVLLRAAGPTPMPRHLPRPAIRF